MAASDCLGSGGNTELAIEVLGVALDGIKQRNSSAPISRCVSGGLQRNEQGQLAIGQLFDQLPFPPRGVRRTSADPRLCSSKSSCRGGKGNPGVSSLARFVEAVRAARRSPTANSTSAKTVRTWAV